MLAQPIDVRSTAEALFADHIHSAIAEAQQLIAGRDDLSEGEAARISKAVGTVWEYGIERPILPKHDIQILANGNRRRDRGILHSPVGWNAIASMPEDIYKAVLDKVRHQLALAA